jgi:flagellar biosynthesis anti-sigma factor FlgM
MHLIGNEEVARSLSHHRRSYTFDPRTVALSGLELAEFHNQLWILPTENPPKNRYGVLPRSRVLSGTLPMKSVHKEKESAMTFRIHNAQSVDQSASVKNSTAQSSSRASQTISIQNGTQDTTSISSASSQLATGFSVRQDKVDSLRAQLANGSYSVDTQAVASSMSSDPFWCPSLPIRGR